MSEQVIAELLDYLGLQRIAIVGTSKGAGVSIGYALNNPGTVTRLVLAAPGGIGARRRAQLGTWLVINIPFVLTTAAGYFARKPGAVRRSLSAALTAGADTPGFDTFLRLATAEASAKYRHRERVLDDWQLNGIPGTNNRTQYQAVFGGDLPLAVDEPRLAELHEVAGEDVDHVSAFIGR